MHGNGRAEFRHHASGPHGVAHHCAAARPELDQTDVLRRPDRPVVAVRLALDTEGLVYRKWGGEQRAKPGDWIVDNEGDMYSVDADVFARTYKQTGTGTYVKTQCFTLLFVPLLSPAIGCFPDAGSHMSERLT